MIHLIKKKTQKLKDNLKNKQTVYESRMRECVLCDTSQQEENLSHARQRNHNIQSSRMKPSPADTLLCSEFVLFIFAMLGGTLIQLFFFTFLSAIFTVSSVLFFSFFG